MRQSSLLHILQDLPDGISEIMVHPGRNTQELEKLFPWGYHWEEELDALTCKEVLESIKNHNIELVNYGENGNIDGRFINLFRQ